VIKYNGINETIIYLKVENIGIIVVQIKKFFNRDVFEDKLPCMFCLCNSRWRPKLWVGWRGFNFGIVFV
jgi:hypothetical protein